MEGRDVKWKPPISIRNRANDCEPGMTVEQVVANNERRPPTLLLVACLRIKRKSNEVAFLRNVTWQLPLLLADRRSEVDFFGSMSFGNTSD